MTGLEYHMCVHAHMLSSLFLCQAQRNKQKCPRAPSPVHVPSWQEERSAAENGPPILALVLK